MDINIFIYHFLPDTFSALISPVSELFSPFTSYITGPSPSSMSGGPTLKLSPLFEPVQTCLAKSTITPFTVVLSTNDELSDRIQTVSSEAPILVAGTPKTMSYQCRFNRFNITNLLVHQGQILLHCYCIFNLYIPDS